MSIQELIVDIVALSDGRFVGRTRMQKTVYLLDAKGLRSRADYYYYNFGPFSDEVADGIADAKYSGALEETIDHRRSDGSPFSIFKTEKSTQEVTRLGDLPREKAIGLLKKLTAVNSTVLELAATIHWLIFYENIADWRSELKRRKGGKAAGGRMEKAAEFLSTELGIAV